MPWGIFLEYQNRSGRKTRPLEMGGLLELARRARALASQRPTAGRSKAVRVARRAERLSREKTSWPGRQALLEASE